MNVSAIIVTRGDVDMQPVLESLPDEWEALVWDNGAGLLTRWFKNDGMEHGEQYEPFWQFDMSVKPEPVADLSVYGRYAAIEYASHDLIYVQDDDVIVSDPQAIVDEWLAHPVETFESGFRWHLAANMPQEFRHDGYTDSCLVGFGACFHRDAPRKAFQRWADAMWDLRSPEIDDEPIHYYWNVADEVDSHPGDGGWFHRTCDVVFTTLTPRVLVDVPKTNLPWATDDSRMYRQPDHVGERARMLELARQVRDA